MKNKVNEIRKKIEIMSKKWLKKERKKERKGKTKKLKK